MPELPEVEAVCERLRRQSRNATIEGFHVQRSGVTAPQSPDDVRAQVAGTRIKAVQRRGKNILIHLSNGHCLRVHLRMTGDLYVVPDVRFRPVTTRAWFELDGGRGLLFDDPRALGKIHVYPASSVEEAMGKLGIEPLSTDFRPDVLITAARRSRKPIKLLLMEQAVVAGLGNIYAAEALFRAGIDPRREAARIHPSRLTRLHAQIVQVLQIAVQSARIEYVSPGRFSEADAFVLGVYRREGEQCGKCGRKIRRIQQGGRSTYFCPGCQK